jgi:hypothetical protein
MHACMEWPDSSSLAPPAVHGCRNGSLHGLRLRSGVAMMDDGDYGITGCWLFTLLSASCGDVTTDDESSRIDDL